MVDPELSESLFYLNRVSYPLAIVLVLVSLVLSLVGFTVPDWLEFTSVLGYHRKFGLWSVCTLALSFYGNGFKCKSWYYEPNSNPLPDFVETTQAVMSLGLLSLIGATTAGIVGIFIRRNLFKLLPLLAGILTGLTVVLFIIGVSVFGGDYYAHVHYIGGRSAYRRWGYWLFAPVIILLASATLLFPIRTAHEYFMYKRLVKNRHIEENLLRRPSRIELDEPSTPMETSFISPRRVCLVETSLSQFEPCSPIPKHTGLKYQQTNRHHHVNNIESGSHTSTPRVPRRSEFMSAGGEISRPKMFALNDIRQSDSASPSQITRNMSDQTQSLPQTNTSLISLLKEKVVKGAKDRLVAIKSKLLY